MDTLARTHAYRGGLTNPTIFQAITVIANTIITHPTKGRQSDQCHCCNIIKETIILIKECDYRIIIPLYFLS
jgi:hypothetical protein